MPSGRSSIRSRVKRRGHRVEPRPRVAQLIVLLVVAVGVAVAAAAGMGPFARLLAVSVPASVPTLSPRPSATARTKPSDAARAVADALKQVPGFKDMSAAQRGAVIVGGHQYDVKGTIQVTKEPATTEFNYEHDFAGQKTDRVHDIATGRYCFTNAEGKTTRLQVPGYSAETDPFNNVRNTHDWRFLLDADIQGHQDWVVRGDATDTPPAGQHFSLDTVEVFLNAADGNLDEVDVHQLFTDAAGVQNEVALIATNFVYDKGVTIPPCK